MRFRDYVAGFLILFLIGLGGHAAQAQSTGTPHASYEVYRVGDDAYVRSLAVDRHRGSMWVGTSVGVLEVDLKTREVKNTFTRDDGLANEYVFAIGVGPKGKVWFGTNAGGVSTYQDGDWKTYFPMHGLADYWVYAFTFDSDGGLWIGTWDGANYVPAGTDDFKTYRDELINIWVYGLDIDAEGRVWFGTEGGVSMYDGAAWWSWTHDDGLGGRNIDNLPRSANTGLGTRSRHDLVIEAEGSETYNPNYVFSVKVDTTGRGVWFGTWGGGASLFKDGTFTSYGTSDGLAGNVVYSIAQEPDGDLWFGTNHGASHFDGETWTSYGRGDGLVGNDVYAISIAPDNSVWLATKGGVTRITKRK